MILILSLFIWLLSGIIGAIIYNNNSRLKNRLLKIIIMVIIFITGNIGLLISVFTWFINIMRINNDHSNKEILNKIKKKYKKRNKRESS
jgi:hypothetical protein